MKRVIQSISTLVFIAIVNLSIAGEGMWLPLLLKSLNEAEMQSMGMKMTAEDIYSVNKGSLKDAIVHFGGFCTSELISSEGLLLTNHHCGYRQIQSHTSLENNYLKNGFWAKTKADELPNPGLSATFIVRIEDISKAILKGVSDELKGAKRQSVIDQNIALLKNSVNLGEHEDLVIRPFYKGNQYFMFVTMTYNDVRLVGNPPDAIGKFGADTDNWVWPRHTGDFSLFRIYAGPDNMPAEYSKDNVPYKPKHFLPISIDGVEEDDFTLVFGFPGRTNQYLPSYAVDQTVNIVNPARIGVRDKALSVIDAAMRSDESIRIKYASKQAGIANAWKKWQGENLGIKFSKGIERKHNFEEELSGQFNTNPELGLKYGKLLPQFQSLYKELEPYAHVNAYYSEVITGRNIELLRSMGVANRLVNTDPDKFDGFKSRVEGYFQRMYKNYSAAVDQSVFSALMAHYVENVDAKFVPADVQQQLMLMKQDYSKLAAKVYAESAFADEARFNALMKGSMEEIKKGIENDIAFKIYGSFQEMRKKTFATPYKDIQDQITELQRHYMKAIMEAFPDRTFFPDANSTMRVTYGKVNGYQPRDAVNYAPKTYLSGVIEKYQPGDYEFDVPEKLLELERNKDYGQYAEDGKMPVCFIGSNHTSGGNSGSPAIDAYGNLIGLNFDRVWEGTMSDINYDARICRNIMVDIRYVLFIIDKFAGAGHLVDEMKLVRPKSTPKPVPSKRGDGKKAGKRKIILQKGKSKN